MSAFDLRLGDCLDPVTGLAILADKSVDVTITDPPFEEAAHTLQRRVKRGNGNGSATGDRMSTEPLPFPPITERQRSEVAAHLARITRRWVLVFCQIEASQKWVAAGEAAGLTYRRTCIWVKPDGMPQYSGDRPGMGYETIVAMHAPGASKWNGGGSHGVFTINKGGDERSGHPTQKPLALMGRLVRLFSDRGELVCDPFLGSGSTGVAAIRAGRRIIGWELDAKFYGIASTRIGSSREQLEIGAKDRDADQEQLALGIPTLPGAEVA